MGAHCLLLFLAEALKPPTPSDDTKWVVAIIVAVIAAAFPLAGVIFSAWLSQKIARSTSINTLATERTKRQTDLALKISDLVSDPDASVSQAARRRFAIAVVKIIKSEGNAGKGEVYFLPMNARVTIGRHDDNDITLADKDNYLSRWHCGIICDQNSAYIDDYLAVSDTLVNGKEVTKTERLNDGDEIELGPHTLKFKYIKENTILSQ